MLQSLMTIIRELCPYLTIVTFMLKHSVKLRRYRYLVRGKAMAKYPQELAQDAVCQSHSGHGTGLWFLPTRPLRLNINE